MSNCYGFFGVMSSGKGVVSTMCLRWALSKFKRRVISNCWLDIPGLIRLENEELYLKHTDRDFFRNSYLYITELHTILESRSASSLVNKNFTQFLTQIGKLDCKVIYDSQLTGQIDLRMREFTPKRYICEKYVKRNNKLVETEFWEPRKLKEQIYIKITLNMTDYRDDTEHYKELGYMTPNQLDFNFFDTCELIFLDREKFMRRR